MTRPNYPDERSVSSALSPSTMAAVDAEETQREAEYQRYLALRETPEYQQKVAAAMARRGL